ncbi:MAG: NAD(P)-binding domain-containing protein [Myxococcales bacterium]|jgi:putative flavoprotein involved in K+ transport
MTNYEHFETIIIGGGQAGLNVAYRLWKAGRPFVILDAHERVGDAWRKRWDSLQLFTPARFNGLPGLPFPAGRGDVVTKDQMADYLESYAKHFEFPVRTGVRVDKLVKRGDRFLIAAGEQRLSADQVVVAMSNYQVPRVPPFARHLSSDILQLHSSAYRNPSQLRPGRALVVGAGNSGADIALELSKTHATTMAGRETGVIPFRIEPFIARHFLISLVRFVGHFVLSQRTPLGRKARRALLHKAGPLVRVKPADLVAAGVERTGRVVAVEEGLPVLEDGTRLQVDNIVWCTGFRPGFSWIDLPIFDEHGEPAHVRGEVPEVPGLYFVGLHFQFAATSDTVTGVARDARHVVRRLLARRSAPLAVRQPVARPGT